MSALELVPGRECGECTACCVSLRIEEPSLRKAPDVACPNLSCTGGCDIYPFRPMVCRTWHCAWRYMINLDADWRPDKCGLLMRLDDGGGIVFQPVAESTALLGAVEFIAELIKQQVPTYISIPTRTGFTNSRVQLNAPDVVTAAVAGNLTQVASLLQGAIAFAACQQTDPERPI